jgi:tetratricopeptide (TPR) repeat protein
MKRIWQQPVWNFAAMMAAAVFLLMAGCSKSKPSRIADHIKRGSDYFAKEDYLKAEIEYLNAYRLDPANIQVSRQLGEIYYFQGNIPKAAPLLKHARQNGHTDEDLRIKMGRIYLTAGKFNKEAREEALAVLDSKPDSDDGWILYSQAAIGSNEMREAAVKLEALRPRAEKAAGFHLAIGTLALRQNNFPAAEAAFKQAIAISPKSSVAHELLANLQLRQNNIADGSQSLKTAAELAPVRSPTPLRYVEFLRDSGDEAGAKKRLEEIIAKAPDYIPAHVQMAQTLFAEKRYDDCGEVLKRILAMAPGHYEAMLMSGRLMLVKKDPVKGLAELEKLARSHGGIAAAHYHLAVAQLLNNDPNKAMASLKQAVTIDPEYAEALLLEADLNIRKNNPEPVVRSMTDLLRKRPQLARAYILLGEAHVQRQNYNEGINVYSKLAQIYPKNPQAHQLIGVAHLEAKRRTEARQSFEKARALVPDYYPAFEQIVNLDLAEGKTADALRRVQEEIQKKPTVAGPHVLQARVYFAQTNLAAAETSLQKAIQLDPNVAPNTSVLMAQILARTGRETDAVAFLTDVSRKHTNDVSSLMQLGMLHSQRTNYAAARQSYEQLLKINPTFVPALNNLANLYSEQFKMFDEAYEMARKGRELDPDNAVIADTLGWILYKRREYGWALGMIQQSAEKLSAEPEVFYHLGMVHYMMGNEDGARTAFSRATTLRKAYPNRDEATQRLALLNLDFNRADAATLARMEKHLADNPGDPIVAGRMAALEEKKGNYQKALAIYERSIAENKGNVGAMARAARIQAEQMKNPKRALELAKAARDASPEDPLMAHILGSIAHATGDSPWAVGLLSESSRKLPDNPEVLYDLALAQYGAGQVANSESTMQRAIAMGKAFPRLETGRRWLTIASLFKDPARLRQSATAVNDWLKAEPSNPAVLMAAGALHELQNNPTAAEQTYTRLLSLYPAFAPASLRLATLQANRPETLPQAFEAANKLRQAQPEDAEIAALLGTIAYKRGDHSRAAQLLAESARKRTTDPAIWYYLGLSQHQLKKTDETRRAFERLLALENAGERATEARRILAELK